MLKKLLKYEIIDMFKVMVIYYILAIIFSIATRIFLNFDVFILKLIGQISNGVMISMFFSIIITLVMRFFTRFILTIYKDEGYLQHTLPVKKSELYLSKLLIVIISIITSLLVILLCLLIAYYSKTNIEAIKYYFKNLFNISNFSILILVIMLIGIEFIYMFSSGTLGILIGYNTDNRKLLKSILFSFGIYFGGQLFLLTAFSIYGLFDKKLFTIFTSNTILDANIMITMLIISLVIYSLLTIVIYFLGYKIFKKGSNVE